MTIAYTPPHVSGATTVTPPGVYVPLGGLAVGTAVAVRDNGGTQEYAPCGALAGDFPDSFIGFFNSGLPGELAQVWMTRGATITPIVEGAVPLTVDEAVYLSATPGEVTQTPPVGPGNRIVKVGMAISLTKILLVTDTSFRFGG